MTHSQSKERSLQQILRRGDVWQGNRHAHPQPYWCTGHPELNNALTHQGWPLGQLIEVCQPHSPYGEWVLWGPAIAQCAAQNWVTVLVNPPATPLLSGVAHYNIDPAALWIVEIQQRHDFVPTLSELLSTSSIAAVLAWEPRRPLSYSELRKLQLSQLHTPHVCCLFRSHKQRHQSSPAALRLTVQLSLNSLWLNIFKQKGNLQQRSIHLPLPQDWRTVHAQPSQASSTTRLPSLHNQLSP